MTIRILRPIYETFKQASKKGGGATPDEIIDWFKKNRPKRGVWHQNIYGRINR